MRTSYSLALLALTLTGLSCKIKANTTPPPADAPAELLALSGASVLIGTGDIAACNSQGDELTAALVDSMLKADSVAGVEDVVMALGDNAYPSGAARDYERCFTPSWGDSNKRIMKRIRPTPGNHEHLTDMATPYYQYFGDRAGSPKKGYYSYDIGEWHIIVLNSEMVVNTSFLSEEQDAQRDWLRDDLAKNSKACTLAYMHHPRFSSGWHGSDLRMEALWQLMYDAGVDIVLAGHDHEYERFEPQTPAGVVDTSRGIIQFVIGTGGGELRGFRTRPAPNSAARVEGHFGVLKLSLGAAGYQHAFIDVSGGVWDPGAGICRNRAGQPEASTTTPTE
jgi:acid phosphatase type 7